MDEKKRFSAATASFERVAGATFGHFMPAGRFAIGLALYFVLSMGYMVSKTIPTLSSFGLTLSVAVVMTASMGVAHKIWRSDSRAAGRSGGALPPDDSGDRDQTKELRNEKRIGLLKLEAKKTRDRVINLGAFIAVSLIVNAVVYKFSFGLSPKEVYLLPWQAIAVMWFLSIALLPRWVVVSGLLAAGGIRFAFQVFGPMILVLLPNFIMLPFFYFFMMIMMYLSIAIPQLMNQKYNKPGDSTWETPEGSMRGQPEARAQVETEIRKFKDAASGNSTRSATRGLLFDGPPGTGKTLFAKEIASAKLDLPFVFTEGSGFEATFMGIAPLLVLYMRYRTEQLAKEYGGAVVFIDEAEKLLQSRGGMQTGQDLQGHSLQITDVWDLLPFDRNGVMSSCGQLFEGHGATERYWHKKQYVHPIIGGFGMGGGGNSAIYPFLTWLNGMDNPPFFQKIVRRKLNRLLDALFIVPAVVRGKPWRFGPGKPRNYNLLFIAATNRGFMIDPAMRRPGRFGITVRFKLPSETARRDIIDRYFTEGVKRGYLRESMNTPERVAEFAGATAGMSPADIEQVIDFAKDYRESHVARLLSIKEEIDNGLLPEQLPVADQKFWKRHSHECEEDGFDDLHADWFALMNARNGVVFGREDPTITTDAHRASTAHHEVGHFIALKEFLGPYMRPTVLSIMPRGQALGMVAHVPVQEYDPRPQRFYEGLIRTSIASVVEERFRFGENQPGVSADLANATSVACFMVGKAAMVPYRSDDSSREQYAKIGRTLISVHEDPFAMPGAASFVDKVLSNPEMAERVAVFLGQAAVDYFRFTKKNKDVAVPIVEKLLEVDEISGQELDDLWNELDVSLVSLTDLEPEEQDEWPGNVLVPANPFYVNNEVQA